MAKKPKMPAELYVAQETDPNEPGVVFYHADEQIDSRAEIGETVEVAVYKFDRMVKLVNKTEVRG